MDKLLYVVMLVITDAVTGFVLPPSCSRSTFSCDPRDASLLQQQGTCALPPRRCCSAINNAANSSSGDAHGAAPVADDGGGGEGGGSIAGGDLPSCFTSEATIAWVQQILASWDNEYGQGDGGDGGGDGGLIGTREDVDEAEQARRLAAAPFAVVSHDFLRDAHDPIFIYGVCFCEMSVACHVAILDDRDDTRSSRRMKSASEIIVQIQRWGGGVFCDTNDTCHSFDADRTMLLLL